EVKMVTAMLGNASVGTNATFIAGPPSTMTSSLAANPAKLPADGMSKSTLTLTLKDAQGNVIAGAMVSLTASGPGVTFVPAMGMTDMNGTFSATMTSMRVGPTTITAKSGMTSITTQVNFTAVPCAGTLLIPSLPSPQVGLNPVRSALADFNGDGKLDIASVVTSDGAISILLGKGKGLFQTYVE